MAGDLIKTVKSNPFFAFVGAIAAVVVAVYGFNVYVDSRVEKAVMDETFLRKLSARVRPYCIFNEKGAILVDGGAMDFLDSIDAGKIPDGMVPEKLVVTPKRYMSHAPLISLLDSAILRGKDTVRGEQAQRMAERVRVRARGRGEFGGGSRCVIERVGDTEVGHHVQAARQAVTTGDQLKGLKRVRLVHVSIKMAISLWNAPGP